MNEFSIFQIILIMMIGHPWITLLLSPFIMFALFWIGAMGFIAIVYVLEFIKGDGKSSALVNGVREFLSLIAMLAIVIGCIGAFFVLVEYVGL